MGKPQNPMVSSSKSEFVNQFKRKAEPMERRNHFQPQPHSPKEIPMPLQPHTQPLPEREYVTQLMGRG